MIDQVKFLKAALEKAIQSGILSQPHTIPLPAGVPFRASVASVALPPGCTPPVGTLPLRIGSGIGPTQEVAEFLALTEAAERYALQYASDRPIQLDPVLTEGGAPASVPITELTIGAPGRPDNTSKGAAAGVDLEDASQRALLEVLEHFHVAPEGGLVGRFTALDPKLISEVKPHLDYLDSQLRILELTILISPHGYCVVRALCRDFDGGRPTLGSAAGLLLGETIQRATEEALLIWRNMVEIEHRGLPTASVSGRQRRLFRIYRGANRLKLDAPTKDPLESLEIPPGEMGLAQTLHAVTGQRVRVFDLAIPTLAVSVARVLLG